MAAKKERAELSYPHGVFNPVDWLRFMELKPFTRRRHDLGIADEEIRIIQIGIMVAPYRAPVVPGTGGLRKLRCFRPGTNKGKRGGIRICYAYFERSGLVVFITAYAKGELDNLTEEGKKEIRRLIQSIERELAEKNPIRSQSHERKA